MNNLEKRTWVYLQSPATYCIAGCSCGNENTQWSEYAKHLWCEKCQKDFIPEHNGVFDGPIGINVAQMLGLHFSRLYLETNVVEVLDSDNVLITCINFSDVFQANLIPVHVKNSQRDIIGTAKLNYKTFKLEEISLSKNEEYITTEFILDFPQKDTFKFEWFHKNNEFQPNETDSFNQFKAYIFNKHLDHELDMKSTDKKRKI